MNIAGGISAGLFHGERTGEAAELDVSLLSTAWWAAGAGVIQGIETDETMRSLMPDSVGPTVTWPSWPTIRACPTFIRSSKTQGGSRKIADAICSKPFDYWRQHLKTMKGQWAPFQSLVDLGTDEQASPTT